ncbi:hypothetical protein ACLOJK_023164, partial [Asimina triloba]
GDVDGEAAGAGSPVVYSMWCRWIQGRADVAGMMGGLDRSIQRLAIAIDEADGKMLGAAAAMIDGWIKAIGLGHKNRTIVMVPSRFGDGGRSKEMRATLPAMTEMGSSTRAAVVDVVLRSQRIWDLLDVNNMMDGLDYLMGCPPSVDFAEEGDDVGCRCRGSGDIAVARWRPSDLGEVVTVVNLSEFDP